jgi:hypothetical protein
MSVAKPRNRLVYFRVSEEEFQKLASMCHGTDGTRSISDLARSAVNRMIADKGSERAMNGFDQKLESLQTQLQILTELLTRNQRLRDLITSEPSSGMSEAAAANGLGAD